MLHFVARRGIFFLLGAIVLVGATDPAAFGDEESVLKPARTSGAASLADLGVRQLERLPWETHIVRFNLGQKRPVSVSACYLMEDHLLVVSASGMVYCLDRRNVEPRWVVSLRYRLSRPPTESGDNYVFLTKDRRGGTFIEAYSRRNGAIAPRFPRSVPFGTSGGPAASGGMVYLPSLGRPGNVATIESVNMVSGRPGWSYNGTGVIMSDLQVDPDGKTLISADDNGVVTALPTGGSAPNGENWVQSLSGTVNANPAVTPEHVIVGTWDGLLYNLDLLSGDVIWMRSVDDPIRKTCPWVLGETTTVKISSEVEGAADIERERYEGIVFARNMSGLHAFDLQTGTPLFTDKRGGRPILRQGQWVVTRHKNGSVSFRDADDEYKAKATLDLGIFSLVPTNRSSGAFFAVTHDGAVVAALPK